MDVMDHLGHQNRHSRVEVLEEAFGQSYLTLYPCLFFFFT